MALGTIRGQLILDVKQAVAGYTAARAASVSTVTAMNRGGAVMVRTGAVMTAAGLAIAAGIGVAVKAAADFEKQLDFFGAVSNATEADMERVRVKALELGRDTRYSAGEIAESFIELGKSGVKAQDIVDGIGEAVASLGAAADIPLTQAASIIVSQVQTFGMAAQDATKVADLLAGAANESMVEIQDLGVSLKYAGGVAAAIGIPFEDLNTALAILGKYGIKGSTAGTSLRQMMVSLVGNTKKASKTMKELGIITKDGSNKFFDATGKLKPLPQVMDVLNKSLDGLTQEEKINKLKTMFNVRALPTVLNLMKEGSKGFDQMSAAIDKTKAADVASARLDNLSGDVEILKGNIETLLIQAGGPLQEMLRGIVQGVTAVVQWFGNLSPATQQLILKFLLITAAVLLVMGTFTMIVGTVLRFAATIMDLVRAVGFIIQVVKLAAVAVKAFTLSLLTNPVFLIIAAIVALVVALVLLYKKNKAFKAFMDKLGRGIVQAWNAVVAWFKTLPAWFANLWENIKNKTTSVWNTIVNFFTQTIPNAFWSFVNSVNTAVSNFVNGTIAWFKALPGRLLAIVRNLISGVVSFFMQLPRRVGYAIGFMVGFAIRLWFNFYKWLFTMAGKIVMAVVNWFKQLPGKIAALITQLNTWVAARINALKNFFFVTIPQIITNVINWFKALPGRIGAYIRAMYLFAKAWLTVMWAYAKFRAQQIVQGIIAWIRQLPQRISEFFQRAVNNAKTKLSSMWTTAKDFARRIYNSIKEWVEKIPGAVTGAVDRAIQAFKDMISRAFNAAKDFASGLWEGFKDGLGINSPSFIEKQMVQITKVVGEETNALRGQVRAVQNLGSNLTKIPHMEPSEQTIATNAAASIKSSLASEAARFSELQQGYADILAKSNAAKQAAAISTAQTLAPAASPTDSTGSAPNGMRMISGELELRNGKAYIRGIAQETYDENDSFSATVGRMG